MTIYIFNQQLKIKSHIVKTATYHNAEYIPNVPFIIIKFKFKITDINSQLSYLKILFHFFLQKPWIFLQALSELSHLTSELRLWGSRHGSAETMYYWGSG